MVGTIDDINYKELYENLLIEFNRVKEERDYWKQAYIEADILNQLLSENPVNESPKGNTPIENRKAEGKLTGQWTSYDKVENFDIFG